MAVELLNALKHLSKGVNDGSERCDNVLLLLSEFLTTKMHHKEETYVDIIDALFEILSNENVNRFLLFLCQKLLVVVLFQHGHPASLKIEKEMTPAIMHVYYLVIRESFKMLKTSKENCIDSPEVGELITINLQHFLTKTCEECRQCLSMYCEDVHSKQIVKNQLSIFKNSLNAALYLVKMLKFPEYLSKELMKKLRQFSIEVGNIMKPFFRMPQVKYFDHCVWKILSRIILAISMLDEETGKCFCYYMLTQVFTCNYFDKYKVIMTNFCGVMYSGGILTELENFQLNVEQTTHRNVENCDLSTQSSQIVRRSVYSKTQQNVHYTDSSTNNTSSSTTNKQLSHLRRTDERCIEINEQTSRRLILFILKSISKCGKKMERKAVSFLLRESLITLACNDYHTNSLENNRNVDSTYLLLEYFMDDDNQLFMFLLLLFETCSFDSEWKVNPHRTFHNFLTLLSFDDSIMLDWLVTNTGPLSPFPTYMVKYLKFAVSGFSSFLNELQNIDRKKYRAGQKRRFRNESVTEGSQHTSKNESQSEKKIVDILNFSLKGCTIDNTSENRSLVDYSSSEESDDSELPTESHKNTQTPPNICRKDVGLSETVGEVMSCLIRLHFKLARMRSKGLLPENLHVLIDEMEQLENLYEQ